MGRSSISDSATALGFLLQQDVLSVEGDGGMCWAFCDERVRGSGSTAGLRGSPARGTWGCGAPASVTCHGTLCRLPDPPPRGQVMVTNRTVVGG